MDYLSVLPCIPTANHQALLADCYPSNRALSGQTPVRQPDANSLSKLTYYCSLKPPKLSKIAAALLKRAQSDAAYYQTSRAKARLCITLVIVKRLIEDCRSDLAYFARECIAIIDVAASVVENSPFGKRRPNMDVIEHAVGAFYSFSTFAENTTIGVDADITRTYSSVLKKFADMCQEPELTEWDNASDLRYLALNAMDAVVNTNMLLSSSSDEFAGYLIPALLFNIVKHPVEPDLIAMEKNLPEVSRTLVDHVTRQPISERKIRLNTKIDELGKEKSVKPQDVGQSALAILRSIFSSPQNSQTSNSIDAVIMFLDKYDNGKMWQNSNWCAWLGQRLTSWSLVQYRSLILDRFLDNLASCPTPTKLPIPDKNSSLLVLITGILDGPASLVGIGVGEVLGKLINVIIRYSSIEKSYTSLEENSGLRFVVKCIAALSNRIYFADQIVDIAQDILENVAALQTAARVSEHTGPLDDATNTSTVSHNAASEALLSSLEKIIRRANGKKSHPSALFMRPTSSSSGYDTPTISRPCSPSGRQNRRDSMQNHEIPTESTSSPTEPNSPKEGSFSKQNPRSSIEPVMFDSTLCLLTKSAPMVRVAYVKMLIQYISKELPITNTPVRISDSTPPTLVEQHPYNNTGKLLQFIKVLLAAIYKILTFAPSRPTTPHSSAAQKSQNQESSEEQQEQEQQQPQPQNKDSEPQTSTTVGTQTSFRTASPNMNSTPNSYQPIEYYYAREVLVELFSKNYPIILIIGTAFLFEVSNDAEMFWPPLSASETHHPDNSESLSDPHASACNQIVANCLYAIATTWNLRQSIDIASQKLQSSNIHPLPPISSKGVTADIVSKNFGISREISKLERAEQQRIIDEIVSNPAIQNALDIQDTSKIRLLLESSQYSAQNCHQNSSMPDVHKREQGRPAKTIPEFLRVDPAVSGRQSRTGMRSTSINDLKNTLVGDHIAARTSSSGRSTPNAPGVKHEPTNGGLPTRTIQLSTPSTTPGRGSPSARKQAARTSKSEILAQLAARTSLKPVEIKDTSTESTVESPSAIVVSPPYNA